MLLTGIIDTTKTVKKDRDSRAEITENHNNRFKITVGMLLKALTSSFVIYDTEYTAWEGSRKNNWKRPGEFREIIEIGAIRGSLVKNKIIVKKVFSILVRPVINPKLSNYIIQLCGITQQMVDKKGVNFNTAWNKLLKFTRGANSILSFGEDDLIIQENLIMNKVDYRINNKIWLNYKSIFLNESNLNRKSSIQSCDIPKALGLEPINKQKHRALSDVLNQIQGLNKLLNDYTAK